MRPVFRILRKAFLFLSGIVVIAIGVILLPLPGPGILIILAGLAILAIEFEWAARHQARIKNYLRAIFKKSKTKK